MPKQIETESTITSANCGNPQPTWLGINGVWCAPPQGFLELGLPSSEQTNKFEEKTSVESNVPKTPTTPSAVKVISVKSCRL